VRPYTFGQGAAVVTGAAGGIGSALAGQLAGRGSSLALIDRDGAGLQALAARLRERHPALRVSAAPTPSTCRAPGRFPRWQRTCCAPTRACRC